MTHVNNDAEGKEIQIVCFKLYGREYGIPILSVKEIVKLERVIDIPELGKAFEGVINLRGQLIPLVDLRKRHGVPPPEESAPKVLILKISNDDFLGAIVDDISEIISLSESDYLSIASRALEEGTQQIYGVVELEEGRSIIILKAAAIQDDRELAKMKEDIKAVAGRLKNS